MSLETDLRRTAYRDLKHFADARSLVIVGPNVDLKAVPDDTYLSIATLPVPPDVRGITNGWSIFKWLVQININARAGTGEMRALDHADAVRDAFGFNYRFLGIRREYTVIKPAEIAPGLLDTDRARYVVPVTITVQAIA